MSVYNSFDQFACERSIAPYAAFVAATCCAGHAAANCTAHSNPRAADAARAPPWLLVQRRACGALPTTATRAHHPAGRRGAAARGRAYCQRVWYRHVSSVHA